MGELAFTCAIMFVGTCSFGYVIGHGMYMLVLCVWVTEDCNERTNMTDVLYTHAHTHVHTHTCTRTCTHTQNAVSSIVTSGDHQSKLIRAKVNSINEYMKYRRLPKHLRTKIRRHYNYSWKVCEYVCMCARVCVCLCVLCTHELMQISAALFYI